MRFIKEAFESNYIAPLGPQVVAFEREFSEAMSCGIEIVTAARVVFVFMGLPPE